MQLIFHTFIRWRKLKHQILLNLFHDCVSVALHFAKTVGVLYAFSIYFELQRVYQFRIVQIQSHCISYIFNLAKLII